MTPFHWLALALTVLQALDGWLTYTIRKRGGWERFAVVQWFIDRLGPYWSLVVTKGGAAVLAWVLALVPIESWSIGPFITVGGDDIRLWLLGALTVWYVVIAAHNYNQYLKQNERLGK